ncbi:MAG: cryptochrome/photolyase family protein [Parahaliea sp.]
MTEAVIVWFRQDLRLKDHPALRAAADSDRPVLTVYILDDDSAGRWASGGASRWWLHHSLAALAGELRQRYQRTLVLRRGEAASILVELCRRSGARAVYCSRHCEPWAAGQEQSVQRRLAAEGVELRSYPGHLLFAPETLRNRSGQPFRVFTPFWRTCLAAPEPELPQPAPATLGTALDDMVSDPLDSWQLRPQEPDWASTWSQYWQPGTVGATRQLAGFLRQTLPDYVQGRDWPARTLTSRLSPHLHFGEISVRAVWHACQQVARDHPSLGAATDKFLSEIGWREFSHHLLHHFPDLPDTVFRRDFAAFPWRDAPAERRAWQRGQTGYPLVDAGMRELWSTGYMHNRVRMVTASFLTKHLLQHWRHGEAWFRDTLVDADLANNACSWQWVAGSGVDAAPYFRIFNPCTQGEKFDPRGEYVRRWVPELAALPERYLHRPFDAPPELLHSAGLRLGEHYPRPLVEHGFARARALAAYQSLREHGAGDSNSTQNA